MKQKIQISNECARIIRAAAILPWKETGKQLNNGAWEIELDSDVIERIWQEAHAEEDFSDALIRIIAKAQGRIQ